MARAGSRVPWVAVLGRPWGRRCRGGFHGVSVTGLPGGGLLRLGRRQVLSGGDATPHTAFAYRLAAMALRDRGLPAPPRFHRYWREWEEAAAEDVAAGCGSAEVPPPADPESLESSSSVGLGLVDPIGVTEASMILRCRPRNVRDLCRRGVFESAQRRSVGWLIERLEVAQRATAQATEQAERAKAWS